jgi:acetyl-CoA/propionyl-CoA carboxylase biotin carboxyl carrier protein
MTDTQQPPTLSGDTLTPIRTLLIANRGEIARRIMRTAQRMGIRCVGVFSEPDCSAPHVREADLALPLGEAGAYRSVEAIVAAARSAGVDAVHPGYGFLSENPELAEALAAVGINFVGPSAASIRQLGSKVAAKQLAASAAVPCAPTLHLGGADIDTDCAAIASFGAQVGFPLMAKAAAGGGGRGMRILHGSADFAAELASARREALQSFGSDAVFVEKCITPARHIEVQIAADRYGDVVALGTRDCSLQRSNQKMIEEAPAPALPPDVEEAMRAAACRLARAANYTNLGTVEFLVTPEFQFYLLEVNTRLQVEHPVTEAVTGIDLVHLQLRLAEGRSLRECGVPPTPLLRGHAIEARLCAEEFGETFVLSTGTISELELPQGTVVPNTSLRCDFGIEVGSTVSHYYDSLLGKIIVWGETRADAIAALSAALGATRISGVRNNRAVLRYLLARPEFQRVQHSIQATTQLLPTTEVRREWRIRAHTIAALARVCTAAGEWAERSPWYSAALQIPLTFEWRTDTGATEVHSTVRRVRRGGESTFEVVLTTRTAENQTTTERTEVTVRQVHRAGVAAVVITSVFEDAAVGAHTPALEEQATVTSAGDTVWVHRAEGSWALTPARLELRAERQNDAGASVSQEVVAHIPGRVVSVSAQLGARVEAGAPLVILDSMKMEHTVRAPSTGAVVTIAVTPNQIVAGGDLLVVVVRE